MLLLNKDLIRNAKGLWGWIFCIAFLKLVVLIGGSAFARVISSFLGSLLDLSMTSADAMSAIGAALIYAIAMFAGELGVGEAEYHCNAKARLKMRQGIFDKILALDVGNVETIGPTKAMTTCMDGVESVLLYYSKYLPSLIYSFIAPIYLFFYLKDTSLAIAVYLLIVSFLIFPCNNTFRQQTEKLKSRYWTDMEDLTGYYLECVRGLVTLKLFNQDSRFRKELVKKANRFCDSIMAMMKVNFLSFLVTDGIIYISIFITMIIASYQYSQGLLTETNLLMILMLSFTFFSSIRQLMNATHSALNGVAASQKIEEIMDLEVPHKTINNKEKECIEGIVGEDVSFAYNDQKVVLDQVDFAIPKNQMIAFVGRSGSGKSTLADLLMHFQEVNQGNIYFLGKNINLYPVNELRKQISMVPQTVHLFSGTIADNLLIAMKEASEEELWNVLEQVHLKDKVKSFPLGLYEDVGDAGAKLSGGEKQKIGIARALLSGAEYMIFDEATSSVDVESENEIWECLNQLALHKTLIIISHRLSTIKQADIIYVLDHGKIVQHGNHDELITQDGLYKQLVDEQNQLEEGS